MNICVYCGSNAGARPDYLLAARQVGELLASREIGIVYGGANLGLMGALADAALGAGGRVTGVMPADLTAKDIAHQGLRRLEIVHSMHERKQRMADLSDGFLALPGGLGTLEEFFEAATWTQLGLHDKPCGLLNVGGFFDHLIEFLDVAVEERFVRGEHRALIFHSASASELLERFAAFRPARLEKWLDRGSS